MIAAAKAKQLKVKSILISQPKPENGKSPYYDLAKKFKIKIDFRPFIHVEGITGKDFRKAKVNIYDFATIIFTSRNSIDHFFRVCDELRVKMPQDTKYLCISEAIALYPRSSVTRLLVGRLITRVNSIVAGGKTRSGK